jgi:hypothetical protein
MARTGINGDVASPIPTIRHQSVISTRMSRAPGEAALPSIAKLSADATA